EARFRALVDNLGVAVVVQGAAGDVKLANRAALELLGLTLEELTGRDWDVIHDDGTPMARAAFPAARAVATRLPVRDVVMGLGRPGRRDRLWLLVNSIPELDEGGSVKKVICTFNDVTERRRMQARLALADRLASVGTLAAGVAHEINNPLSYVVANLAYIAEELRNPPQLAALAQGVAQAQEGAPRRRGIRRPLRPV